MLELGVLIFAALLNIMLGLVVFLKNGRATINRLFLLLAITLTVWSVTNYISLHPVGLGQLAWARLVLFWAAFLNLALYLTFLAFPHYRLPRRSRPLQAMVIMTGVVMLLTQTPLVFNHLEEASGIVAPVPGPGIALFLLQTVLLLGASLRLLYVRYHRAHGLEKHQLQYVLLGLLATFSLIFFTNFVLAAFFKNTVLIFLGPAYTLLFSASVAYSIVRHKLFDIRLVVARSVAYVLLLFSLAGLYAGGAYAASSIFFSGAGVSPAQQTFNVALTIILAFTFQPLRRFFEHVTDRIFFRDRYDSEELLSVVGKIVTSELSLPPILGRSLKTICARLRVAGGRFVILDNEKVYQVIDYGDSVGRRLKTTDLQSFNQSLSVADDLAGGRRKRLLDNSAIRVSVRLRTKDEFLGYLFLGDKQSGDIYSSQDLQVLRLLADELAVAIVNAKAYEKIARFNITLQEKVTEATKRLRSANRHLKALDKAKDEFISMAAHQLRTPLTAVKGYLSMVQEGDAGNISASQREYINTAYDSSDKMVRLISDLLNVSRLSSGRFMIEQHPTNMIQLVTNEIRQMIPSAHTKGLSLAFIRPKGRLLPPVLLDADKTRQVIMNFIDNALYYTPRGGVTVTLSHDANNVRFAVSDTGIGVPPADQKKLFRKFYRAGNARGVRPDGTGLGLYLAKRVIEDQGGRIIFYSEVGKGSTFGFTLPLRPAAGAMPVAKKPDMAKAR